MRKERINEIWGVVFLLLGLFTTASLIFFREDDLGFYTSNPNAPALNYTGLIGSYLAHGLLISFGLAAYLIPLLFLIWSWCFFVQRVPERKIFKLTGLGIALISASVFLAISFYPEKRFLRGGAVGYVLGSRLLEYFGPIGCYIVTGSCFLLAVLLATDFLISPIIASFWEGAAGFFESLSFLTNKFRGSVRAFSFKLPWKTRANGAKPSLPLQAKGTRPSKDGIAADEGEKTLKAVEFREKVEAVRSEGLKIVSRIPQEFREPARKEEKEAKAEAPEAKIVKAQPLSPKPALEKPILYVLPPLDLTRKPELAVIHEDNLRQNSRILEETLSEFGIEAQVVEVEQGPVITRYELLPAPGVKVNRIVSLGDDLALAMKATSLRFISPIPGKSAIGIEIPNMKTSVVYLRELLESEEFRKKDFALPLVIGKDTSGKPLIADLTQMPHLLIAGTTGSGKTVCVNSIIAGLLYRLPPDRLKFVMVDPKMVELAVYHSLPHMLAPVVTDPKKAAATLNWVVSEMENRYRLFASRGVRNIQGFNAQSEEMLPYIVVVIDELADLMMIAQDKVEGAITRLAQLSRAVGIHLILATQRPSVDVITGVIKANFPARISFKVASKVDSRTVLDMNGADKLLGKGDLLFLLPGESKLIRGQGAFVDDGEISRVAEFASKQRAPEYHPEIESLQEGKVSGVSQEKDELFDEAVQVVLETGVASSSTLQRRLRLGYTRAARIIDQMEAERIVGPHNGSKPREILVDRTQALREPAPQQ